MKQWMLGVALVASANALIGCGNSAQNATSGSSPAAVKCREVAVAHKKEWGPSGIAGTAIGGAAGGLLGNQFGGGKGKTALTAAGAVGGAVGGHELAKGNDTTMTYQERCSHSEG